MAEDTTQEFQGSTQNTTFITNEEVGSGNVFISGKTLRRNYVYKERATYIGSLDPEDVFDEKREAGRIESWKAESERMYPDEGDYLVNIETGVATFIGEK